MLPCSQISSPILPITHTCTHIMQMFQLDIKCICNGCACQQTSIHEPRKQQRKRPRLDEELQSMPLHGLVGKIRAQPVAAPTHRISRAGGHQPLEDLSSTDSSLRILIQQDRAQNLRRMYQMQKMQQLDLFQMHVDKLPKISADSSILFT